MNGRILWTKKVDALHDEGRALLGLVALIARGTGQQGGPRAAIAWDDQAEIWPKNGEEEEQLRPYPLLILDFPEEMRAEIESMARGRLKFAELFHLAWVDALTCLVFEGEDHVIELCASDLFPLLRQSNLEILVAMVCSDEVTLVEYDFNREDLFYLCGRLQLEHFRDIDKEPPSGEEWALQWSHTMANGTHHWQPLVDWLDSDQRY